MKNMTCRQLGGACDQKLSAQTWDEMVKVMTKHVMEKHPDVAKAMEKMRVGRRQDRPEPKSPPEEPGEAGGSSGPQHPADSPLFSENKKVGPRQIRQLRPELSEGTASAFGEGFWSRLPL